MNECIFDIDPKLLSLASEAENECREMFEKIDSNAEYNGQKCSLRRLAARTLW